MIQVWIKFLYKIVWIHWLQKIHGVSWKILSKRQLTRRSFPKNFSNDEGWVFIVLYPITWLLHYFPSFTKMLEKIHLNCVMTQGESIETHVIVYFGDGELYTAGKISVIWSEDYSQQDRHFFYSN